MTKRVATVGRALAVTLTVGVTVGLAGCGDQRPSGPGYASKDNVVEPGSSDAALTREEFASATTKAVLSAGSSHVVMTMKGPEPVKAEGDMTYGSGTSDMQLTMSMPQLGKGKVELRLVDETFFLRLPGLTPPGKFVAFDPKDQSSPLAKSFAGFTDQMDPMVSMRKLESATVSLERVGEGDLGGTSVDHYRMVVDSVKALKSLGEAVPKGMPETLTYDLWLDDDDLIRRMSFELAGTSFEMLLSKWGRPFTVQRPAARDIAKAPSA